MQFTVIIPVYNRPEEIDALLRSLVTQDPLPYEVIVVEDGSSVRCEQIVNSYLNRLNVKYFFIENSGQGFARNFGMEKSTGDFFVMFDSDCVIPKGYFNIIALAIESRGLDAFGGPDAASSEFSILQKAMNYSMTSFLTTGGIRGKLKNPGKYQARGYNMGLSKNAFTASGGFVDPNSGEDIELSIRLKKMGYRLELVEEAYVYHNRKSTFTSFFRQSFSFGRNRINISRYHSDAVKLVHLLPMLFLLFWSVTLLFNILLPTGSIVNIANFILVLWLIGVLISATVANQSLFVGFLAVITSFGQLSAYGLGLLYEWFVKKTKG
ncbi:glycosyltransferase [Belliella kenyensis]|uniref:Glycosyltransferase n=1 Tax=Belliella kenyensis TaxID=1472724 RepID=A0ABV8EI83_9BACT|nr:glycosyltransferase [Belliella kenyensis]MCH7402454.1 glycosyltransferase [Belliella kenyensis]MDN3603645.1 glycosyltransferase [Belliella kenyensis]